MELIVPTKLLYLKIVGSSHVNHQTKYKRGKKTNLPFLNIEMVVLTKLLFFLYCHPVEEFSILIPLFEPQVHNVLDFCL